MKRFLRFLFIAALFFYCRQSFSQTVDAGSYHSLILCSDSTVKATGANGNGQIGDGTFTNRLIPVYVSGLNSIVKVSGGYHSMAIKSNSTVWAWGYNGYGQLGDGTTFTRTTPVQVSGLTGAIAISASGNSDGHSLALKSDSTVWAWGYNWYGQLGDGTNTNRNTPVQVSGLTGIIAIAAGYYHSIAVKNDGTVWAWGANWD